MDEFTNSPNGRDQIEVTRSMISQGQVFRLRLQRVDDTAVTVDLQIGEVNQPSGRLQGQLGIADMVPAARALTSLLGGAAAILGRAAGSTSTSERIERIERIRQKYPNAYTPWTAENDGKLLELHHAKVSVVDMARHFGRKPTAITSRLDKVLPPEADPNETADESFL